MPLKFFQKSCARHLQDARLRFLRQQFFETQARDLPMLFRRDGQFRRGVILKTPFENGKHLLGGLAGGTNDENVSEALPVSTIAFRQLSHDVCGVKLSPELFLCRPAAREMPACLGFNSLFGRFFADFTMPRETLDPGLAAE